MDEKEDHSFNGVHKDQLLPNFENNSGLTYDEYYSLLNLEAPDLTQLGLLVVQTLTEILEANEGQDSNLTTFHVPVPPAISLEDYMGRITRYSCCSAEVYILAVVYIDKYFTERELACLSLNNVHK